MKEHIHAPPFQPVTFMITKELSLRCLSQVLMLKFVSFGLFCVYDMNTVVFHLKKIHIHSDKKLIFMLLINAYTSVC